ncbi:MAG: carbohydrate-binding protein [Reinekea sp.]|jgi:hypothetical protein|nr:carbohydrate-binding protein [Reinekea sp.]
MNYRLKLTAISLAVASTALCTVASAQLFQAEDYTWYSDTTTGNSGRQYRNDNVDIEKTSDVGGGYNVGWIAKNEWLSYEGLDISEAGTYRISVRTASPYGSQLRVELNGGNIFLGDITVPKTGGWQQWQTTQLEVDIQPGQYSLGVKALASGWNFNWIQIEKVRTDPPATSRIEAEDYDAFYDKSLGNIGGAYRNDHVDIEITTDTGGGYNVGWWQAGEWLRYNDVTFPVSGYYTFSARVASEAGGGGIEFDLNKGAIKLGKVAIPSTGGWQQWQTVSQSVYVEAGTYPVGVYATSGGFNLNWIDIVPGDAPPVDARFNTDKSRGEWTLVVVPDTQHYSQNRPNAPIAHMRTAFDWLVAMRDTLNIQFVQGLGDITETWDSDWEWQNSTSAWYKLYGEMPFMPIQGNHDSPQSLNKYFPVSSFQNETWYAGDFGGIENNYALMDIGNERYLFLQLEAYDQYSPYRPEGLAWGQQILRQYPDRKVILATHDLWATQTIKNNILTKFDNVILANAGHDCVRETHYTTRGPNGGLSHNFVSDYQCDANEVMLLRFYKFKPLEDKVEYYTYSPVTHTFEVDAQSEGAIIIPQAD